MEPQRRIATCFRICLEFSVYKRDYRLSYGTRALKDSARLCCVVHII